MKPAPFEYRRAKSVDEAIEFVAQQSGFAKFIAGGQTLGPMINLRLVQPDLLVDISCLDELRGATEKDGSLIVGAGTPHAAFEDGNIPDTTNGLLRRVAGDIAYRAVRNRGTIGGSIAHADPAAEWPTLLMALNAHVHVRSRIGRRSLPMDELLLGPMTTALGADELIESIQIPRLSRSARWGFTKRCRKVGEFAYALTAVISDRERGVTAAVIGATGGVPVRLRSTSALIAGEKAWKCGLESCIRTQYDADIDAAGLEFDDYSRHVHGFALILAIKEAFQA